MPGISMKIANIAANIAPRPEDGSEPISASTYDGLVSTDLAAVDAVDSAAGCVGI
tara:strand:+ start:922 stop:1086 length:165 start_codon:yes stop_codon:yes gene_type:complete